MLHPDFQRKVIWLWRVYERQLNGENPGFSFNLALSRWCFWALLPWKRERQTISERHPPCKLNTS